MKNVLLFVLIIFLASILLASLNDKKKLAYIPSLKKIVSVNEDVSLFKGEFQIVRILKQNEGEWDDSWELCRVSVIRDTILTDALFEKQKDDGTDDPLTRGTLEYRRAVAVK